MKKLYSIVLMAAALLIGTNAWAADVTVVNETTSQSTTFDGSNALQSAIDFIGADQTGTITLNNSITLDAAVVMPHITGEIDAVNNPNVLNRVGQNITLNLNGKTITGANAKGVILIFKGSLDITGNGEIIHNGAGVNSNTKNFDRSVITVYGAPWSKKDQVWSTLTIGENVTVKTGDDVDKVYGLCIQNTSASPLTEATLGYLTYYAKASAPAEACQNGLKNLGCAYGVKVFVNGKVYGHMRGINVLGTINAAPKCDIDPNLTQRQYDAYPYYDYNYPYINIGSTAQVWCVNDGVANDNNGGIYGGGYAVYDISGEVYGQTGIYLKSGDFKLTDANIYSTATTVGTSADYHSGKTAGAGIFIGSDASYAGGQAVELEGDTKVSGGSDPAANGIIDVVATNAQSTGSSVSHVTVEGGTIEGGINLTSNTSDVTTVYGAQITGEVVVDGNPTTVATITPSGTHVTEIEINGKPTIVVSEGAGPADDAKKTTWNEIAALSNKTAPADVAWTAVGEGTISSDLYFGELQMISGTDASNIQKLTINSGATLNVKHLMMNNYAQIVVEAGAKLIVNGEQGIVAPSVDNIVLEISEENPSVFLFNPAVNSNRHPHATVKIQAKQIGYMNVGGTNYWFWHRFALPIEEATSWTKVPNVSSFVYGWNYENDNWEQYTALTQMKPFCGTILTADQATLSDVEYTFTGILAGGNDNNSLKFVRDGYHYFGNSYTGHISIDKLVEQLMGDSKIDGTVWVWGNDQNYHAVPLMALRNNPSAFLDYQKEIAPMQTFVLKQNVAEQNNTELNYASAVWGNPRYATSTGASAPRRAVAENETTRMRIVVTAENGKSDDVMFFVNGMCSDEFDNGYDGTKYMNENALNMFASVNGQNYSVVATDDLEGKMLTINTIKDVNYTMSFANVNGEEYAIRDNVTNQVIAIKEGATYEFAAQPNSVIDGRFEIVGIAKLPTAIENAEAVKSAKGIYTIMGQYVGENMDVLPAGIYVVNGVKIVK